MKKVLPQEDKGMRQEVVTRIHAERIDVWCGPDYT